MLAPGRPLQLIP